MKTLYVYIENDDLKLKYQDASINYTVVALIILDKSSGVIGFKI